MGYATEALGAFRLALILDPNAADAWSGKGDLLFDLERQREALEAYRQATVLAPDHLDGLFGVGVTLLFFGRAGEARIPLEKVVELDSADASAWRALGDVMGELGETDAAAAADRATGIEAARSTARDGGRGAGSPTCPGAAATRPRARV